MIQKLVDKGNLPSVFMGDEGVIDREHVGTRQAGILPLLKPTNAFLVEAIPREGRGQEATESGLADGTDNRGENGVGKDEKGCLKHRCFLSKPGGDECEDEHPGRGTRPFADTRLREC